VPVQEGRQIAVRQLELEQGVSSADDPQRAVPDPYLPSRPRRLARPHVRERPPGPQQALDEDLHAPSGILDAVQTRRDHPRVVEHQQVAGAEVLGRS